MKKSYIISILLLLALLPSAVHAQQNVSTPPPVDVSKVHIIKMGVDTIYFTPEELGETGQQPAKDGKKRASTPKGSTSFGYQYATYTYPSVTSDGTEVTLSSLIAWPIGEDLNPIKSLRRWTIKEANNLIIGCHVTIASNKECPSEWPNTSAFGGITTDVRMYVGHAGGGLSRLASSDDPCYWDVVIIPDYEGYGETKSRSHPYLDEELTARQVIDGVRYGLAWYNTLSTGQEVGNRIPLKDSYKSIAVGYSQGGAVAMAVHRLIETGGFANELHFGGSVCGDGPYDILETMKVYINWDRVYYPVAAAMILKGMVDHCPYVYHHKLSDYLSSDFTKCGIVDWIESKDYTTNDIRDKLYDYYKSGQPIVDYKDNAHGDNLYYMRMQDLLTPGAYSFCKSFSLPEGQWYGTTDGVFGDLQRAFEANSLLRGWQPQHPMFLLHSYNDHVVPFVNAESALKAFGNNSNFHLYGYGNSSANPRYDADLDDYGHNATGTKFMFDIQRGGSFEEESIKAICGDSSSLNGDRNWTKIK